MNAGFPMRWVLTAESALIGGLLAALLVALCARLRWRWLQVACALTIAAPAALVAAAVISELFRLRFERRELLREVLNFFDGRVMVVWIVLAGSACLVLGLLCIPWYALWRKGEDRRPVARDWRLVRLSCACFGACLLFLGTTVGYAWYLGRPIRAARQSALETAKSLVPTPVADDDNAYPLMVEAADRLPPKDERPAWFEDPDAAPVEEWRGFLDQHEETLELFSRAVRRPHCRLPIDAEQPITNDIERLESDAVDAMRPISPLVRLAHRQSQILAADGNVQLAIEHLDNVSLLVRHLRTDPRAPIATFANVIAFSHKTWLEELLHATAISDGQIELPIRHAGDPRTQDLPVVVSWDDATRRFIHYGVGLAEPGTVLHELPPVFRELGIVEARVLTLADDLWSMPGWSRRMEEVAQADDAMVLDEVRAVEQDCFYDFRDCSFHSVRTVPELMSLVNTRMHAEVCQNLTDLGLAVAAYRAAQGKYPEALADLIPDYIDRMPTDPWDGKPLKMSAEDGGVVLYSVGHDGHDDGGKLVELRGREREGDKTFCLGRPFEKRKGLTFRGW